MKCPRCQQENPVGALFCGQCGAQLEVLCFGCHAPNPPANRFCHRCGQPLATAAGSVSASTAVVTHDDPSVGEGAKRRGSTVRRRLEEDEVPDQDREPDDVGSPRSRAKPKRLCIVSRDRLRSGDFNAALRASVRPEDQLEIVMDRRHGGSSGESDPKEDRRQLRVDLALEANGFAIVPAPVDPTKDRTPLSLLLPEAPIERLSPEDPEDEERLESFQRQRSGTLIEQLLGALIGVTLAALVLSLVGQITGQSLLRQLFTGPLSGGPDQAPGQTNESFTRAQLPAVTEKPVVAETRPSTKSVPPRDADRLTPRQRETSGPSEVTGTTSREPSITSRETSPPPKETSTPPPGASTPANETGAPLKAGTDQGASGGRPRLSATARPSPSAPAPSNQVASALSPEAATPKATPTQLVGAHRAELVRGPVSRGWGDSYAVRLLDPAGKPMVGADVLLVAHMADGTVENVAMGALPEPGTYRGTVPTGRSTPVNLRVRVSTGDKFVEVPVRP